MSELAGLLSKGEENHEKGPLEAGSPPSAAPSCRRAAKLSAILAAALTVSVGLVGQHAETAASAHLGKVRLSPELDSVVSLLNWDLNNKLPPWMSPIKEGSPQGVAVVLGQSLKPDGSAAGVMLDRAHMAKKLLDEGKITKLIVCGSDPAGVGRTEASVLAEFLKKHDIPEDRIIMEYQSSTTAENAWFALRWIPEGTGQIYIITSDFHMARATYIFQETFDYFYKMLEDAYRKDPRWVCNSCSAAGSSDRGTQAHGSMPPGLEKRYPRLTIHQATTQSFCGSDASQNKDDDDTADINSQSLARRAMDELGFLGGHEVEEAMYGEPLNKILYIWPIQINVTRDPENNMNYRNAMAQAMTAATRLCQCKAPPEVGNGPALSYPLTLPISTSITTPLRQWPEIVDACRDSQHA